MAITVKTNSAQTALKLYKIKEAIEGEGGDRVTSKVAFWTLGQLIERTPKKWTGQTRKSWLIEKVEGGYQVTNTSKVMLFLEKGTTAHGPVKAKVLYIPLTKAASMGWNPSLVRGVDYILRKRVAGIWNGATGVPDPRGRVEEQRQLTRARLFEEMTDYIREIIDAN